MAQVACRWTSELGTVKTGVCYSHNYALVNAVRSGRNNLFSSSIVGGLNGRGPEDRHHINEQGLVGNIHPDTHTTRESKTKLVPLIIVHDG